MTKSADKRVKILNKYKSSRVMRIREYPLCITDSVTISSIVEHLNQE